MATKKPPAGTTTVWAAGRRIQSTGEVPPATNARKTGIARALSNPGASKRSAKASARLQANSAKKKGKAKGYGKGKA